MLAVTVTWKLLNTKTGEERDQEQILIIEICGLDPMGGVRGTEYQRMMNVILNELRDQRERQRPNKMRVEIAAITMANAFSSA